MPRYSLWHSSNFSRYCSNKTSLPSAIVAIVLVHRNNLPARTIHSRRNIPPAGQSTVVRQPLANKHGKEIKCLRWSMDGLTDRRGWWWHKHVSIWPLRSQMDQRYRMSTIYDEYMLSNYSLIFSWLVRMLVFHPRLEQRQIVENPKWEWGKQELGEGEFIWPIESAVKRLYGIRQLGLPTTT